MKLFLLLVIFGQSLLSFGQSKNEIIEEAQRKESLLIRKIDSLQLILNSTSSKLKAEQKTSADQLAQVTKMNFETSDLRIVMYKHVASIDSLVKLLDDKTKQYDLVQKSFSKCEDEKRSLMQLNQASENPIGERDLVTDIDFAKIKVSEASSFKFNLTVNAMGAVIDVQLIAKNSTDSDLLKILTEEIKKQVRYRPSSGAEMITVVYTCLIYPN